MITMRLFLPLLLLGLLLLLLACASPASADVLGDEVANIRNKCRNAYFAHTFVGEPRVAVRQMATDLAKLLSPIAAQPVDQIGPEIEAALAHFPPSYTPSIDRLGKIEGGYLSNQTVGEQTSKNTYLCTGSSPVLRGIMKGWDTQVDGAVFTSDPGLAPAEPWFMRFEGSAKPFSLHVKESIFETSIVDKRLQVLPPAEYQVALTLGSGQAAFAEDAKLIKCDDGPRFFLVQNNVRRHINTMDTMAKYAFDKYKVENRSCSNMGEGAEIQ